jgi:hypothetical protein
MTVQSSSVPFHHRHHRRHRGQRHRCLCPRPAVRPPIAVRAAGIIVLVLALAPGAAAAELLDAGALGERGAILETIGEGFFALADAQGIGDFNGDGRDDVALAVRETGLIDGDPLAVLLVYGRPGLSALHPLDGSLGGLVAFRVRSPGITGNGRALVAPAGDLDGDGLADFVFSFSDYHPPGAAGQGAAFLVYGSRDLIGEGFVDEVGEAVPGVVFDSSEASLARLDQDHAAIGDFDGDGEDDFALGAFEGQGAGARGLALVFMNAARLPARVDIAAAIDDPGVLAIRGPAGRSVGAGIARGRDFNGDGLEDLLLSDSREAFAATLYLVYGRRDPPRSIDLGALGDDPGREGVVIFRGASPPLTFAGRGQAVGVRDLDGDGFDELLLGLANSESAPPGGSSAASVAQLFYGSASFPDIVNLSAAPAGLGATFRPLGGAAGGDGFGISVAVAGDTNGDGLEDLLIGAPYTTVGGRAKAGDIFLLHGKRDFPADLVLDGDFDGLRVRGAGALDGLGRIVAPAGDFNGDGARDLLAVSPNLDAIEGTGKLTLVYTRTDAAPLSIRRLDPAFGSVRGGTRVVVTGSGFAARPELLFGGRQALDVVVESSSVLTCKSPPFDEPRVVEVVVRDAERTARLDAAYEYVPHLPEIDLAEPGSLALRIDGAAGKTIGEGLAFGDFDGDGTDDLAIGSLAEDGWLVSIVRGGGALPETLPAFSPSLRVAVIRSSSGKPGGIRVAALGDLDQDGIADLGISSGSGAAFVFLGRRGLSGELAIESEIAAGRASRLERGIPGGLPALAPLGDLDGDGAAELAYGLSVAPAASPVLAEAGEILIVKGRRSWPAVIDLADSSASLARVCGSRAFHALARQLAPAGDVNGDGSPDLIANSGLAEGRIFVYLIYTSRALAGELDVESWVEAGGGVALEREGRPENAVHPLNVAPAGDVDGDGDADVIIGDESGGSSFEGVSFLVLGGPRLPALLKLDEREAIAGVASIIGAAPSVQSGRVGPAADFNGDGLADVVIGAQNSSPALPGTAHVVFGSRQPPARLELRSLGRFGHRIDGVQPLTRLEARSATTGDLDGDGVLDFAFGEVGSPGSVAVIFGLASERDFIRSDANYDRLVNISDSIFILTYLFLGGADPACLDAVDSNDTGALDLSDAVYLLNHLFLGSPPPPAPYPEPGSDPTPDALDCRGF